MDQKIVGTSFQALALSPEMQRAIGDAGYVSMTGIQERIIPSILEGRDVIGQSSTGTGKTAAFGIPAIEGLVADDSPEPQVLVMCPTRELAMQVSDELRKFSKYKEGVRIVTVYGGQNIDNQIRALKRCSIVVGTPGRILDHIRRRTLKLSSIRMAVLDEADIMLDMGFLGDIKQILFNTPKERQTVLFSATMPKEIMRVTQQFLRQPEHVMGDDGQVAFDLIRQYYVEVPQSKKARSVGLIFTQYGAKRGLVFCNTKIMVDRLVNALNHTGLSAQGLHGDMRQAARTKIMAGFKSGEINVLVATDVAARGIDAEGIDIIINYDIPQDIEFYVHRIGRTGRAGHVGVAFTLIAGSGELFGLRDISDQTGVQLVPYNLLGLDEAPTDSFPRNQSGDSGSQPAKAGRDSSRGSKGGNLATISIDVGRNHDVMEKHIVDSILKYTKVRRGDIGEITLLEEETHIRLQPEAARTIMRGMKEATVNDFLVTFRVVDVPDVKATDKPGGGKPSGSKPYRRRPRG